MTISLAWHEVISWAMTIVSITLLADNYRRDENTKYYMVLQGVLRACNQRSQLLAHLLSDLRASDRQVPRDEVLLLMDSEYINYVALQEHLMGSMKSLNPHKDLPFDAGGFVQSGRPKPPSPQAA
jgi:hypothetical protein